MSNVTGSTPVPRVLFFGMQGNFSYPSLHTLLENGIEICAVVIPASQSQAAAPALMRKEQPSQRRSLLPVVNSSLHTDIVQLAWERDIPVWEVYRLADAATIATFSAYEPDIICVACFSRRIPRAILDIPRLGCLNVHPSLLPAHRGPEPLFWSFRDGDRQTGVTIHLMDERMDTGDILAQEAIAIPDDITYRELERQCATIGGRLLTQTVWNLSHGLIVRIPQDAQDEARGSYNPFPSASDFIVPVAEWEARHVYNFIRGIQDWNEPILLQTGKETIQIENVIACSHKNTATITDTMTVMGGTGQRIWLRCKAGWIEVTILQHGS